MKATSDVNRYPLGVTNLVVLVTTRMILAHPDDEVQYGHKRPDGVRVAA
jgi:hypothetical protein